jgi:prepilin-type N-terminal cleavage/methylation domain-containing protein
LIKRGFTIVELMVVISLVTILIALILPNFGTSRESARMTLCMGNLHNLGVATDAFTNDYAERLPGIWGSVWVKPSVGGGGCWLSNPPAGQSPWQAAPQTGELWPYTQTDPKIYRCPSLKEAPLNTGKGSNGKFDYSAFHAFAGTRRWKLPQEAYCAPFGIHVRAPWMIEESPMFYLNNGNAEGGFGGGDKIGAWHNGAGNLVGFDSSVVTIQNSTNLSSYDFYARTPSNQYVNLASHSSGFGGWEKR